MTQLLNDFPTETSQLAAAKYAAARGWQAAGLYDMAARFYHSAMVHAESVELQDECRSRLRDMLAAA